MVQVAASQQKQRGHDAWHRCQTCTQDFTGAMRTALAEAWQSRVERQAAESLERLAAQANLAQSLMHQGKHSKAEPMLREL